MTALVIIGAFTSFSYFKLTDCVSRQTKNNDGAYHLGYQFEVRPY
jgi:hypothetical protein